MKIQIDGIVREMTAEEAAEFQKQAAITEALEKSRPLTESEVSRMVIAAQINTLTVDDNTALRMVSFYPLWASGMTYEAGFKVRCNDTLYRCLTAHTAQEGWEPDVAPSLWAKVLIPDENVIPEWEQPESTNPYMAGDVVSHNGRIWVSDVDNNTWEPSVSGWTERDE